MEKQVYVVEDENFVAVVGTNDRTEAEKALREAEVTWYGENQEEPQLDINEFSPADIYYGKENGEEMYYFGVEPHEFFNQGTVYETTEGFVGTWEDIKK